MEEPASQISIKDKESAFLRASKEAMRIAAKMTLPAPLSTPEIAGDKARRLGAFGALTQAVGIGLFLSGDPTSAILYPGGKLLEQVANIASARTKNKLSANPQSNDEAREPNTPKMESRVVNSIAITTAASLKILLPSAISARMDIEGKGRQINMKATQALESIAIIALMTGNVEVAVPAYVVARTTALITEASYLRSKRREAGKAERDQKREARKEKFHKFSTETKTAIKNSLADTYKDSALAVSVIKNQIREQSIAEKVKSRFNNLFHKNRPAQQIDTTTVDDNTPIQQEEDTTDNSNLQ